MWRRPADGGGASRIRSAGLVASAVLGGALVGAGVAAAVPEDEVIHACRHQNTGQLRVVDDGTGCRGSEAPLQWNVRGPRGEPGAEGVDGLDGADGVSGWVRVTAQSSFDDADFKHATATCPEGTRVLGGGAVIASPAGAHQQKVFTDDNAPTSEGTGWRVGARESVENGAVWGLTVHAICAVVD